MKKTVILALAVLFSLPVMASDDVKTLPPAMYSAMKSGQKLDKVFVDPSYNKSKGFKVSNITYKAELRITEIIDLMNKSLGTLGTADATNTLKVTVVKVSTKTYTGFGNIMGAVTVEGQIIDPEGKVLVCFSTKAKAGPFNSRSDDYASACDTIASAIVKDLL